MTTGINLPNVTNLKKQRRVRTGLRDPEKSENSRLTYPDLSLLTFCFISDCFKFPNSRSI